MADDIPAISFLIRCKEKAASASNELIGYIETKDTGHYYLRYGFVKEDRSGLSDDGERIIEYFPAPENLIPLLAGMLERESECYGSWILLQKKYPSPHAQIYQFEANSRSDSSFVYAVFLFEIGILGQRPSEWAKSEPHGYYLVPFSSLGKRVISYLAGGITISPETKSEIITEQSQPTTMVPAQININIDKLIYAPDTKQIHTSGGDNLQESTKYKDIGEIEHE